MLEPEIAALHEGAVDYLGVQTLSACVEREDPVRLRFIYPRCQSTKPHPQDFDEVKSDYCRKHHITIAELCARLERDNQLASELYRLALAVKLTRVALKGGGPLIDLLDWIDGATARRARSGETDHVAHEQHRGTGLHLLRQTPATIGKKVTGPFVQ